jgi:hypothetical protein
MSDGSWIERVIEAIERRDRWSAYLIHHRSTGEPLECCFKAVRNLAEEAQRPFPSHWHDHNDDPELRRLQSQLDGAPLHAARLAARLVGAVLVPLGVGIALVLGAEQGPLPAVARWGLGPLLLLGGILGARVFARRLHERRMLRSRS